MKKYLFLLWALLVIICSNVTAQTIDLNRQDIYVRKGFNFSWVHRLPENRADWIHIPGTKGSRSLVIRNLGLKDIPTHRYLSFKIHPTESFSFITSFNIDVDPSELPSMSLFLRSIASNWEIFLNGVSIEKEINYNDLGEIIPKRGKGLHVLIPANLIRSGKNILYYHIISDPTGYGAGFYYGEPYTIGPTKDLLTTPWRFFSISRVAIYLVIAFIWFYLFVRQPKYYGLEFSFAILSISFAFYNAIKAYYDLHSGTFGFISFRLEYMMVFFIALMFALVVNIYLKHKITFITKIYCSACALFVIFSLVAPPGFMFDLLRSWQVSLPFMSGYLTFLSITSLRVNMKRDKTRSSLFGEWKTLPVKEAAFSGFMISILLLSVLFEAVDSIFWKHGLVVNRFGFLIWTIGMSGVLFNRYISASQKVEEWNESLEKEVLNRTTELQRLKEDIEAVFSTSGDGIVKFSLDLQPLSFNDSFCSLFGYSRDEMEKMDIETFYDDDDLDLILKNRIIALKTGYISFRTKAKHKNGNYMYLNVTSTTMRDQKGEPTAIVANMKNITKEVVAEKQLLEAKNNLEGIFTALPDLYFRLDKKGTYLDYYGSENLLYRSKAELIGSTVYEILPKNVSERIMKPLNTVIKEKKRITVDYELEINGELKSFEAAILPFHNNQVICGVKDITVRKQAEKKLRKREKQYRALVENMEDVVLIVGLDRKILFMNHSLLTFLGKRFSDVVGKKLTSVLKENSFPVLEDVLENVIRSTQGETVDVEIDFGQFPLWFEFSFIPQVNEARELYSILCIGRDTTERIQYEIDLQKNITKLRNQKKQLSHLTEKMVNIQEGERKKISLELHDDIGQAMTVISILLESFRSDIKNDKELEKKVKDCQRMIEETSKKIHRFSQELRPPELDDLGLISALKSHSRKFSALSGIAVNIEGDPLVEQLDTKIKTTFYRIFQEGLNNAAKHANASKITIRIHKQNESFLFNIEDNGKGFNAREVYKNISDRLGLIGVEERVKALGGKFSIDSKPSSGTRLNITLPIQNQE